MTAATPAEAASPVADREIILTREFEAPRERLWEAYTNPRHLPHWYGPDGFRVTLQEMDARPGGTLRFIMHGPDGTDYGNRIVYQEMDRPEQLVYRLSEDVDDDPGAFHVTVRFDDLGGGRTRLTQRMLCATAAQRAHVEGFGAVELGYQTLGRLAAYLQTM